MGVIYELTRLSNEKKRKFVEGIIRQEAAKKLHPQRAERIKVQTRK
jgi:hypothetical protein